MQWIHLKILKYSCDSILYPHDKAVDKRIMHPTYDKRTDLFRVLQNPCSTYCTCFFGGKSVLSEWSKIHLLSYEMFKISSMIYIYWSRHSFGTTLYICNKLWIASLPLLLPFETSSAPNYLSQIIHFTARRLAYCLAKAVPSTAHWDRSRKKIIWLTMSFKSICCWETSM